MSFIVDKARAVQPRTWLIAIIVLCIAVRIAVLLAFPGILAFDQNGVVHGNEAHDTHAVNLLKTGVFGAKEGVPDADFPPLYVYVITFIYKVFGRGYMQIGIFQTLLDVLAVILLYQIGSRLFTANGKLVGLVGALFYSVYPYLIFQNLTLVETGLFITELYALLWLFILLRERTGWDRRTWLIIVASGFILGLGLLTRPIIGPIIFVAAIWFLFKLSPKQTFLRLLPVVFVAGLVLLPWTIRNYVTLKEPILISTNGGENIYFGNSPYTLPFLRAGYHPSFTPLDAGLTSLTRNQRSQRYTQMALDYLSSHPDQIPALLWAKFLAYWSIDVFPTANPSSDESVNNYQGTATVKTDANGNIIELEGLPKGDAITEYSQPLFDKIGRTVHKLYFGGLLLLGLIGVVLSREQWRTVSLLWLLQVDMTIIYVVFNPSTRYRAPTDGLLFLFSAYTLAWAWAKWRSRVVVRPAIA